MVLESYDLLSLRNEVKTEFGERLADTSKDSIFNKCINDAIRWIIRSRDGRWPWQIREFTLNIQPRRSGTLDATQGSATATWVSGPKPIVPTATSDREIISFPSTQVSLNDGFLITDFVDPTITLDAEFIGESGSGLDYTLLSAYYILPDDYQNMLILLDTSVTRGRIIKRNQDTLEWIRRDQALATSTILEYTIVKDPFPFGHSAYSNRQFLLLYPYPGERITIRGKYTALHHNLASDTDVPMIPQQDRDVVFRVANWMFAMKAKDASLVPAYKSIADEAVKAMERSYTLDSDELDFGYLRPADIGPVSPPPNFPSWDLD